MGLAASMEEQNAKCEDGSFQPESISMIKTSLMGPFAGIGDSFFQGTLRIITFGNWPVFAQQGNVLDRFWQFFSSQSPPLSWGIMERFWAISLVINT